MKNYDLISIIVPVYNAEKYLDRCIESLIKQTYRNIEILLVNDGSKDKSGEICNNWSKRDNRIKVIHKENGGASSARNIGLENAIGDYIGFVDSDDTIECEMYERLYDLMCKYKVEMAICEKNNRKKKSKDEYLVEKWGQEELLNHFFRVNGQTGVQHVGTRLIKKNILNNFRFIEGRMNEDVHASYYFATSVKDAVYTNEGFYNYFLNQEGVTNREFTEKNLDLLYIWDVVYNLTQKEAPEYVDVCNMNVKRARFTLLGQMLLHGYDKNNKNLQLIKKQLKSEVQNTFWELLRVKMSFSRKILLFIVCIL